MTKGIDNRANERADPPCNNLGQRSSGSGTWKFCNPIFGKLRLLFKLMYGAVGLRERCMQLPQTHVGTDRDQPLQARWPSLALAQANPLFSTPVTFATSARRVFIRIYTVC